MKNRFVHENLFQSGYSKEELDKIFSDHFYGIGGKSEFKDVLSIKDYRGNDICYANRKYSLIIEIIRTIFIVLWVLAAPMLLPVYFTYIVTDNSIGIIHTIFVFIALVFIIFLGILIIYLIFSRKIHVKFYKKNQMKENLNLYLKLKMIKHFQYFQKNILGL